MRGKNWIQLCSGERFWPLEGAGHIWLSDIAHNLSQINRYSGATIAPYSVAQHAINCARVAPGRWKLWCLHHDDPEFVLNDVARPLKHRWFMGPYRRAERKIMRRIAGAIGLKCESPGWFGWCDPVPPEVKEIDTRMMATEIRYLFHTIHPDWMEWIKGIEPYPLPRGAFVSTLPSSFYKAEWLGLHSALQWDVTRCS